MAGRVEAVVWQGLVVLLRCWGCRTSTAKRRGPWKEQIGGGPAVWVARSFGVTVLLHLRQTHSGCHSRVVWSMLGAHSMWRVGSSRHDASSSGWLGLTNARRGQHNGMMFAGGLGGWSRGAVVSAGVSGTGHSSCAAARA